MSPDIKSTDPESVFVGGEMGALMRDFSRDAPRTHDWSQMLLGTVETQSQSLQTVLSLQLTSLPSMLRKRLIRLIDSLIEAGGG